MGLIPTPLATINRFFFSFLKPATSDITGWGPTENYIQRNHSNSGCKQTLLHRRLHAFRAESLLEGLKALFFINHLHDFSSFTISASKFILSTAAVSK